MGVVSDSSEPDSLGEDLIAQASGPTKRGHDVGDARLELTTSAV